MPQTVKLGMIVLSLLLLQLLFKLNLLNLSFFFTVIGILSTCKGLLCCRTTLWLEQKEVKSRVWRLYVFSKFELKHCYNLLPNVFREIV